eukprot:5184827-Prorocentrum_lima.AAC.1
MQTYELLGLPVNVGPKKTAIITALKGEGSSAIRRTLVSGSKGMVLSIPGYDIPVVREYKYLGTIVDDSSVFHPEVLHRTASARKA